MSADLQSRLARPLRLLSVGDELLRGEVIDRNGSRLALRLGELGWEPDAMAQVPDRGGAVEAAVKRWTEEGGALIVGGGLGPTADDLTREAIATGLGVALASHPEATAMIAAREQRLQRRFTAFTHRQAQLPQGCAPLANPVGTAPGFWLPHASGAGFLMALPGVPAEYAAISAVCFPGPPRRESEDWQILGLGEDRLAQLLDDFPDRDRLGFYPSFEGHRLRVPCDVDREDLARRLSGHVASQTGESPEAVLLGILGERGETLAVAESCTGGLLGARLTRVAGSSATFLGGVISYCDRVKEQQLGVAPELIRAEGAVSEAVARAMATGARKRLGSDRALAITGIAGPGGERPGKPVGTLHIAAAGPTESVHRHLVGGWDREDNRRFAALQAITLLWQILHADSP